MFSFSAFLHFAHLQDSSRSKTTKQEKVLWFMVYFYDIALGQYIFNFCEPGIFLCIFTVQLKKSRIYY